MFLIFEWFWKDLHTDLLLIRYLLSSGRYAPILGGATFTQAQSLFCCLNLSAEFLDNSSAHWLTENIGQRGIVGLFLWFKSWLNGHYSEERPVWISFSDACLAEICWCRFWEDGGNNCAHSNSGLSWPSSKPQNQSSALWGSLSQLWSAFSPLWVPAAGQGIFWVLWGMRWEKREGRWISSCCCCCDLLFWNEEQLHWCARVCVRASLGRADPGLSKEPLAWGVWQSTRFILTQLRITFVPLFPPQT